MTDYHHLFQHHLSNYSLIIFAYLSTRENEENRITHKIEFRLSNTLAYFFMT